MTNSNPSLTSVSDREVVSVRVVNASKELTFQAWTDPNHLQNWWGPKGFTNTLWFG